MNPFATYTPEAPPDLNNNNHKDADPAPPPAANGAPAAAMPLPPGPRRSAAVDPIPAQRSPAGGTVPAPVIYKTCAPGSQAEYTSVSAFIESLAKGTPGRGGIGPVKEHHLRMLLERARAQTDRHRKVHDDEVSIMEAHNEHAAEMGRWIDSRKEAEMEKCRAATRPIEDKLQEAENTCSRRAEDANAKAVRAGGTVDPHAPSEESVLRLKAPDLRALAARLRLPFIDPTPPAPKPFRKHLSSFLPACFTVLIGAMMGISIGFLSGCIGADNLSQHPFLVFLFILLGIAAAGMGALAIDLTHKIASERFYLGLPVSEWMTSALLAFLVDGGLLMIDINVEYRGILANAQWWGNSDLPPGSTPVSPDQALGLILAAGLLTLGYVVSYAARAYLAGRREPVLGRLIAQQSVEMAQADAERRSHPDVRSALDSVGQLKQQQGVCSRLRDQVAQIRAPYDQEIARLEALRVPMLHELPQEAQRRIQDAYHQLLGTHAELDKAITSALDDREPDPRG
jgi:hypothetical protein